MFLRYPQTSEAKRVTAVTQSSSKDLLQRSFHRHYKIVMLQSRATRNHSDGVFTGCCEVARDCRLCARRTILDWTFPIDAKQHGRTLPPSHCEHCTFNFAEISDSTAVASSLYCFVTSSLFEPAQPLHTRVSAPAETGWQCGESLHLRNRRGHQERRGWNLNPKKWPRIARVHRHHMLP